MEPMSGKNQNSIFRFHMFVLQCKIPGNLWHERNMVHVCHRVKICLCYFSRIAGVFSMLLCNCIVTLSTPSTNIGPQEEAFGSEIFVCQIGCKFEKINKVSPPSFDILSH